MTIHGAAAHEATLRFVLWSTPFGMALLLLPSLWWLFRVFKWSETKPEEGRHGDAGAR